MAWSGRADRGPILPVINALKERPDIELLYLSLPGNRDALRGYSDSAKSASIYLGINNPDIFLVLGDRYEMLAACGAATVAGIPIAHIHGGETTQGAFDDQIRNAITKLSHIHFVSNTFAEEQLHFLGESGNIYNFGAPGLDNLSTILREWPRKPDNYFVVTYHPETHEEDYGVAGLKALLDALKNFPDFKIFWTGVNNDPGNDKIKATMDFSLLVNWEPEEYLRRCRHAACVIGNSSSFIIETPALGVPGVNIGDRQKGRIQSFGTINCEPNADDITSAIRTALNFREVGPSRYGTPGASKRIARLLADINLDGILRKIAA